MRPTSFCCVFAGTGATSSLQVEEGSLYPALQRLAVKGWVKAEWGVSDNNRRARLYRLTQAGRKQLAEEVADFERLLGAILRVVRPA